jgi:hypothetical protein
MAQLKQNIDRDLREDHLSRRSKWLYVAKSAVSGEAALVSDEPGQAKPGS